MSVAPESTTCVVDLLEMESSAYMYLDGITTVTFFDGPVPLEQLKERLVKVVQASPWLAGKLVKKKGKKVQMAFDSSPTAEYIQDKLLDRIELDLSTTDPYEALIESLSKTKAHVKETGFVLAKKGIPYTRVSVVANKNAARWALVFSVSHVVADGYTYYKALGMLSSMEDIFSLNPTRRHSFVPKLKAAVGPKEYATYMGAVPLVMNFVGRNTRHTWARCRW